MFSVTGMQGFEMFSLMHLVTLFLFFFTAWWLVYYRQALRAYQKIIKWTLFFTLLACEVTYHVWLVLTNQWDVSNLPLQLCSLSTFIALFLFLKPNQKAFWLLYFIGAIPPILSMVTPDMVYQFPHYRYIKYFLHHSAIPLAVLYFILFEGYRVPKKAVLTGFLTLNVIAVPVFFLNLLLGTNFFYLASPTETKTLLSFFGNGAWYYVTLEAAALVVFFITYLPMHYLQRAEQKRVRDN
ncbi:YwaF family protein [Cytobacillus firmus]|uniref:YwaF family protein n=1 Tax=Cytobacillus firmus TaxID=1399 RepID=UPI0024C13BD2|nr:TIGR02206 family membrane protein [Cytobacillus firmus]WHY59978.1 TIGR02206 family membrane protein [Cytobacillus firmus]